MNDKIIFERLIDSAIIPQRANPTDSGMDFFSPMDFAIAPKSDFLLPLGLKVKLPLGMDLVFENKSGRSTKNKLVRGACVVDEGYRGEIHAHLFNLGRKKVFIKAGEKIIQGIIRRVEFPEIIEGMISDVTSRGKGGFGSTGITYHQIVNPINKDSQTNDASGIVLKNLPDDNESNDNSNQLVENKDEIKITNNENNHFNQQSIETENKVQQLEQTISKLENIINTLVQQSNSPNLNQNQNVKKEIPPNWKGGIKVNHN
jgi:deoxyuridine 5'-triphosphate nucleotidohydrolase